MTNVAKLETFDYVAHPLANMFPMIEGKEFEDLKNSVRLNGILVQIVLYQGMILDGRNRYGAAKAISYKFSVKDFREFEGSLREAEEFVIAANINRRNLTNAQKQEVIRQMIQKNPALSNRQIAKKCGMSSHSTVAAVRDKLLNPPELKEFQSKLHLLHLLLRNKRCQL
jgi:ParB-like chromosome segregation protein Spo0J